MILDFLLIFYVLSCEFWLKRRTARKNQRWRKRWLPGWLFTGGMRGIAHHLLSDRARFREAFIGSLRFIHQRAQTISIAPKSAADR